ncbi:MAG: hypothetical protein ACI9QL_005197, partial [Candidatus Omnitrophota bacterium]
PAESALARLARLRLVQGWTRFSSRPLRQHFRLQRFGILGIRLFGCTFIARRLRAGTTQSGLHPKSGEYPDLKHQISGNNTQRQKEIFHTIKSTGGPFSYKCRDRDYFPV